MENTKIYNGVNKTFYYAARGFAILFILMTALFALDLEKFSWSGLFIHLLPTLLLLLIFAISLWRERVGGILWILAAIAYVIVVWGDVAWLAYLVMSGPALIIGILFLLPNNEAIYIPTAPMPQSGPALKASGKEANNS